MAVKDLTNMQFDRLTAREIVGKDKRGYLWRCECSCGGEKIVPASYLLNKHTRSCGCINREIKENAIKKGDRWGKLEAQEFVRYDTPERGHQAIWLFKCDCGNFKEMPVSNVKFGNVRSCGCKATEHITNLRRKDITGETFDRLTADHPTDKRDASGSIIWVFNCSCGNTTELSVNTFKSGRVHSCGCLYRETRSQCTAARKDIVDHTSLSLIAYTKKRSTGSNAGHPGVWYDKKKNQWHAYINFQKKRYHLGIYKKRDQAISAREEAEKKLHDPVVWANIQNLTPESRETFINYLLSGASINTRKGDKE